MDLRLDVPEAYERFVRFGTCSWKYPSWGGLVYREGRQYHADEFLADYAKHLKTVEVDRFVQVLENLAG